MVDIYVVDDLVFSRENKVKVVLEFDDKERIDVGFNVLDFVSKLFLITPEPFCWVPQVGSVWHWEPMLSHASQRVKVVEVKRNEDGEIWVGCVGSDGTMYGWDNNVFWNELGRFIEACVLVDAGQ